MEAVEEHSEQIKYLQQNHKLRSKSTPKAHKLQQIHN